MNRRIVLVVVAAAALVGLAMWAVVRFTEPGEAPRDTPAASQPPQGAAARRITATLFYVAADGLRLVPAQREVLYGATPAEQARHLIQAQLEPPPEGLGSAIPPGVTLRGLFVDAGGNAYADFSADLRQGHPGGSLTEIFTTYALVNAVTTNLPAIRAVQILVDGREIDTLAGHVDLRRPLPGAPQGGYLCLMGDAGTRFTVTLATAETE